MCIIISNLYLISYLGNSMTKDISINIRIDETDQRLLDKLCEETVRTKSDMVRYLIRKEYDQRTTTDKPTAPYAAE